MAATPEFLAIMNVVSEATKVLPRCSRLASSLEVPVSRHTANGATSWHFCGGVKFGGIRGSLAILCVSFPKVAEPDLVLLKVAVSAHELFAKIRL